MTPTPPKPHYGYIDCIRGYAVLMVMTGHYAYLFPNLPYPVHRIAVMGWYGVQLFFITSSLTLLLSWDHELRTRGVADTRAFFMRRFFRIAPAYYTAGVLYFFVFPPLGGFDAIQALATASFLNNWHPALIPTVAGRWNVVPGGWSISVEFTFYLLFPWFAALVRSLRAAVLFILATIIVGAIADRIDLTLLAGAYKPAALRDFLFFWFPNEASVFGFGAVVFLLIRRAAPPRPTDPRLPILFAAIAIAAFFALAFVPLGHFLGDRPFVPASLAVCPPLALFVVAMSRLPPGLPSGLLVNRFAAAMGKVSFSAYLLHFAVLAGLEHVPRLIFADATGYGAIVAFVLVWPVAALLVFAIAWCSYSLIERPGMALGKALIRQRRAAALISTS